MKKLTTLILFTLLLASCKKDDTEYIVGLPYMYNGIFTDIPRHKLYYPLTLLQINRGPLLDGKKGDLKSDQMLVRNAKGDSSTVYGSNLTKYIKSDLDTVIIQVEP